MWDGKKRNMESSGKKRVRLKCRGRNTVNLRKPMLTEIGMVQTKSKVWMLAQCAFLSDLTGLEKKLIGVA